MQVDPLMGSDRASVVRHAIISFVRTVHDRFILAFAPPPNVLRLGLPSFYDELFTRDKRIRLRKFMIDVTCINFVRTVHDRFILAFDLPTGLQLGPPLFYDELSTRDKRIRLRKFTIDVTW